MDHGAPPGRDAAFVRFDVQARVDLLPAPHRARHADGDGDGSSHVSAWVVMCYSCCHPDAGWRTARRPIKRDGSPGHVGGGHPDDCVGVEVGSGDDYGDAFCLRVDHCKGTDFSRAHAAQPINRGRTALELAT